MALVEILGKIAAHEEGGADRLIGRLETDRYALGELTADGAFQRRTPALTFDNWASLADAVLSGDPRAITWPHATNVLALGVAVLRALLAPPSPPPPAPLSPEPSPDPSPTAPSDHAAAVRPAGPQAPLTPAAPAGAPFATTGT